METKYINYLLVCITVSCFIFCLGIIIDVSTTMENIDQFKSNVDTLRVNYTIIAENLNKTQDELARTKLLLAKTNESLEIYETNSGMDQLLSYYHIYHAYWQQFQLASYTYNCPIKQSPRCYGLGWDGQRSAPNTPDSSSVSSVATLCTSPIFKRNNFPNLSFQWSPIMVMVILHLHWSLDQVLGGRGLEIDRVQWPEILNSMSPHMRSDRKIQPSKYGEGLDDW